MECNKAWVLLKSAKLKVKYLMFQYRKAKADIDNAAPFYFTSRLSIYAPACAYKYKLIGSGSYQTNTNIHKVRHIISY